MWVSSLARVYHRAMSGHCTCLWIDWFVCITLAVTRPSVGTERKKSIWRNVKMASNVSVAAFTQQACCHTRESLFPNYSSLPQGQCDASPLWNVVKIAVLLLCWSLTCFIKGCTTIHLEWYTICYISKINDTTRIEHFRWQHCATKIALCNINLSHVQLCDNKEVTGGRNECSRG